MVHNRRTVFLIVCFIVVLQALYYVITLNVNDKWSAVFQPIYHAQSLSEIRWLSANTGTKKNIIVVHTGAPAANLNASNTTQTNNVSSITVETVKQNASITFLNTSLTTTTTSIATKINSETRTTLTINITTAAIPFENASFYLSFNHTNIDLDTYNKLPSCNFSINNNDTSIYKVTVTQILHPYYLLEQKHSSDLHPGGHYIPKDCRTQQRLALIICYRNREQHLKMFLDNIHPFLKTQQIDYTIFIVNQNGKDQFNRAALFNVGYIEAMKLYPYDCFIFHDVDLIPEDLRNLYKCTSQPRHMSVAVDKFNYKLLYSTLFGGVTAFNISDLINANGYPTVYWGWGGEDDDMYLRVVRKLKKSIVRYPIEIARYKMIRTHDHTSGKANPHRHTILYSKYDYNLDGINTTNYTLHNVTFYKLFTLINVTLTEEPFERIRTRLRIKKKKKK